MRIDVIHNHMIGSWKVGVINQNGAQNSSVKILIRVAPYFKNRNENNAVRDKSTVLSVTCTVVY